MNDESPVVTVNSLSIREELQPGTAVCGAFTVTDKDESDVLTFDISGRHIYNYSSQCS